MRTVGHRKEHPIVFSASGALLAEGAHFNDEIHRLPTADRIILERALMVINEQQASVDRDSGPGM